MEKVKRANSGNSRQNGQNGGTGVENSQNYLNELPVKEPHYLGVRLTWEKKCNALMEAHRHVEIAISADSMFTYRRLQNQMTKGGRHIAQNFKRDEDT